ncbi:kinase [Paenibacillus tengchongensis]|uniref:kinase n=1 Tax=Paenibacillus tengchongensis TaxID=2608684 RepID=UPI00124DE508|nr:kinase [Paenibacillus tengchongensis]
MSRVWIIGPPGAGKTYFSHLLSEKLNVCTYELDNFYWKSNWSRPEDEDFIKDVKTIADNNEWIIDGYYELASEYLNTRATILIKMEISLPVLLFRIIKRSIKRMLHKTKVCGGNEENILFLLSKEGLLRYAVNQHLFFKNSITVKEGSKVMLVRNNKDMKKVTELICAEWHEQRKRD